MPYDSRKRCSPEKRDLEQEQVTPYLQTHVSFNVSSTDSTARFFATKKQRSHEILVEFGSCCHSAPESKGKIFPGDPRRGNPQADDPIDVTFAQRVPTNTAYDKFISSIFS